MTYLKKLTELIKFKISPHQDLFKSPSTKIKLADNIQLTDIEYDRVGKICDVFTAIANSAGNEIISPPIGGVFWEQAKAGMGPFDLYLRKNRKEIDLSMLLYNCFRDFCALAYEFDHLTPSPDFWIRRWQRLARAVPKHWRAAMPARFGELGWNIDGYPINRWTSVNQERISAMTIAGIPHYLEQQQNPQIMEIGGGSGEMGYTLCKALPNCTWYNADLLGCLIYSAIHLSVLLPQKRHSIYVGNLQLPTGLDESLIIRSPQEAALSENTIVYIPHFLLGDFTGHLKLHFAYNTYSFGEMPSNAVEHYVDLLADFLKDRGILFDQNGYFPDRGGDNAEDIIAKKFSIQAWPPELDGRRLPNGPTRVWYNNEKVRHINNLISASDISKTILSLNDGNDAVDIHYPNEILWPKVYEMLESSQRVNELYAWESNGIVASP